MFEGAGFKWECGWLVRNFYLLGFLDFLFFLTFFIFFFVRLVLHFGQLHFLPPMCFIGLIYGVVTNID